MDPAKLKVVELRSQLGKRGLDTKGNKAVLVERLRKALEDETGDPVGASVPTDSHNESSGDPSSQDEREKTPEPTKAISPTKSAGRSPRSSSGASPMKTTPIRGSPKTSTPPIIQKPLSPEKLSNVEDSPEPITEKLLEAPTEESPAMIPDEEKEPEQGETQKDSLIQPVSEQPTTEIPKPQFAEVQIETTSTQDESSNQLEPVVETTSIETTKEENSCINEEKQIELEVSTVEDKSIDINTEICEDNIEEEQELNDEHIDDINESMDTQEVEDETMDTLDKNDENREDKDQKLDEASEEPSVDSNSLIMNSETELATEIKEEKPLINENETKNVDDLKDTDIEDTDMKLVKQEHDVDRDSKDQDRRDRKDRKRKRSTSSQEDRHKSPPPNRMDDEPEIDNSRVLLSWYDSDLNLVIDKSKFLSATPMHNDGFGYVWAGARASFGFSAGKVYYEVKITHECNVTLEGEEYPHVLRAGWSVACTSMQLGEEKLSYGYGGTGKKSTGNSFMDYGTKFGLNDILGCYLDMSSDNIIISYTLNGENLGEAFQFSKVELEDKALYPHVLTKNCAFVCNFGDDAAWTENILEGFVPVGQVDLKDRVPGPQRPEKREECEMIMMVGLPAAGKTVWANKYAAENPHKMYNILGTNSLVDKMKVIGLPRKRNYHGRWELLIEKCTRCLNKLLEVAATRRRNYILDQTNVYPSAQRRKMRHFYGFQRKAIVIVPTDEELKSRTAKREAIEGKDVPDTAVLEMKANFGAPAAGESFDTVEWVELDEEEAKKLIAQYNKEGKDAGYNQQQTSKRPRFESRSESHRDSRDIRSGRNNRDNRDHRDRRSGYSDRNRNSTWRGGNHMGGGGNGWRDRGSRGSGAHMRHTSGGYGGSSGGWRGGRGGQNIAPSHRGNDRRGSSNDRRSAMTDGRNRSAVSRQGGGWGPMNSNYHNSGHTSSGWGNSGSGSQSSGSWSSQSQQQGSYGSNNPSGSWGQQQNWGNWKSYGQSNYSQSNYSQQGYGNGNWGGWNQQYYNQYWGGQQQSSQSGQSTGSSGQSAITSSGVSATPAASTTSTSSTYNSYPQAGWQGYTQSYYSTDSPNTGTQQQK